MSSSVAGNRWSVLLSSQQSNVKNIRKIPFKAFFALLVVRQWLALLLAPHQKPHVGIAGVSLPHPSEKGEMAPLKPGQLSPVAAEDG